MAIDRPEDAEVAEKQDVTGMHASVTDVVNNVQNENIGRNALNPDHVPSAIVDSAFKDVSAKETVTSSSAGGGDYDEEPVTGTISLGFTIRTGTDGVEGWKPLTEWRLAGDTSGAGYSLPAKCGALIYFNCRVSRVTTTSEDEISAWFSRGQLWLALGFMLDGTETYLPADFGVIRTGTDVGLPGSPGGTFTQTNESGWHDGDAGNIVEQPVSMWTYIEPDALNNRTIGGIRIRAAAIPAVEPGDTSDLTDGYDGVKDPIIWDIIGGQMGLIIFQKCAS